MEPPLTDLDNFQELQPGDLESTANFCHQSVISAKSWTGLSKQTTGVDRSIFIGDGWTTSIGYHMVIRILVYYEISLLLLRTRFGQCLCTEAASSETAGQFSRRTSFRLSKD